jgi:hypothetical protein
MSYPIGEVVNVISIKKNSQIIATWQYLIRKSCDYAYPIGDVVDYSNMAISDQKEL